YAILKSGKVESVSSLFKGSGLELNIQADAGRKFDEFFTSDERTYKVVYKRNNDTLFVGWIEPEGYYESFTADTWFIQVNCLDGLSYLENLSYVQPSGLIWSGRQTALEIIINALERTNLDLDVFTNIDVFYTGADENEDILGNIYFNSERFYKDDGETIMSCEEVLKDLLQIFGASIIQYNGRWLIYKINQLYNNQNPVFWMYDYQGTIKLGQKYTPGLILSTIGSQINNFPLFHCNTNQQIGLEKGIGSLRIYYEFGFANQPLKNPYLILTNDIPDNWTVLKPSSYTIFGTVRKVIIIKSGSGDRVLETTGGIDVVQGQSLKVEVWFIAPESSATARLSLILTDGSNDYSIDGDLTWITGSSEYWTQELAVTFPGIPPNANKYTYIMPPAPVDGLVKFSFNEGDGDYRPDYCQIDLNKETTNPIKGEIWTFENKDIKSSKVADNIEVYNGDALTDFFIGNIYKKDADTRTATWNRKGGSEELPILHLLGSDLMRLQQKNALLFEGDVKGFVDYFSVIQIDGFDGLFTIMGYNYQAKEDITNLQLKRFFGDSITNLDIGDSPVNDYGNTVKPTIKG
ncbi:hypothetical protein OAQ15_04520, partial [Flavobacteriaceae bacterium]|nr:hypothetical protein [Flavobacteriaceae bacterium]